MTDKERKEYLSFMYSIKNEYNCTECPENMGMENDFDRRLPCGQHNCWVTCHIKEAKRTWH